ncbi:Hypothetical predicted protein [Olea europaea subsp. europaea]|uniref:Uncharacterized protein n=1 Tax=Olea europaea subsp. europaea TaxID=158383 RepID=A0A8S0VGH8_OLEEU|nr:Hypothetical predicted protein [Olea europaea subsp. europaea]
MAASQSHFGDSFSFEDFQKLLTRPYITPNFLTPANVELKEFYLGPAFNNVEAIEQAAVGQLFPCTQGPSFLNSLPLGPLRERGTNAKVGDEIYAPQFFARQLSFDQTWHVPPCYSRNLIDRFHAINKVKAEAIDARNILLTSSFSLAPFNPSRAIHPLFEQLWPSVKRRLFAADVNRAFHSLDQPNISSTSPILVTPLSIRSPSFPARTKQSARPSTSLPAKPTAAKSAPSRKRPVSASPILEDDADDDDDTPLIVRRKVIKLVYS